MSAELYVCLLALFRLRLVAMFLDPSAGREHIERCCELHRPKAFIGSAKAHLLRLVSHALRRIPRKFVIGFPIPCTTRWSRADRLAPLAENRRQYARAADFWEKGLAIAKNVPGILVFSSNDGSASAASRVKPRPIARVFQVSTEVL